MSATFLALDEDPHAYGWYVSDVKNNVSIPVLNQGDIWVTGGKLANALQGERTQFIRAHSVRSCLVCMLKWVTARTLTELLAVESHPTSANISLRTISRLFFGILLERS